MACARCDSLARQLREAQEELAEWRRQDKERAQASPSERGEAWVGCGAAQVQAWREALGLRRQEARLLLILVAAKGERLATEVIAERLWGADRVERLSDSVLALRTQTHQLRKAMKRLFGAPMVETAMSYGLVLPLAAAERLTAYVAEAEAKRAAA